MRRTMLRNPALPILLLLAAACGKPEEGKRAAAKNPGAELQARIDAADAGTTVTLEAGTYAGPVRIRKPLGLAAAEGAKVEILTAAADGNALHAEGVRGINIVGIDFGVKPGRHGAKTDPEPLVSLRNSRGSVRGCAFRGGRAAGLKISGKSDFEVADCVSEKNAQEGMLISTANAQATISDCSTTENEWSGIWFQEGASGSVMRCKADGNGYSGIVVGGQGAEVAIRETSGSRNGYRGFMVTYSAKATIKDCVASDNGTDGIDIISLGAEASVRATVCERNGNNGIHVQRGAAAYLEGNTFGDSVRGCGILVRSFGTSVGAFGNTCSGNKKDGIQYSFEAEGEVTGNTLEGNSESGIAILHKGTKVETRENRTADNALEGIERRPEDPVPDDISSDEVRWLVQEGHFERLRGVALRATDPPIQTEYGGWAAESLFDGLIVWSGDSDELERHNSRLREWARDWPESHIPRIALISAYKNLAWAWRGSGFADTVTEEGWERFRENLEAAESLAGALDEEGCRSAALFSAWITLGMGRGYDRKEMEDLLRRGLEADPRYHPVYANYAYYLLPRWHGSAREVERFARDSIKHAAGFEDEGMYARVAHWTARYEGWDTMRDDYSFDYELIARGFRRLMDAYGETDYLLSGFAKLACIYEDRKTARELLAKIGDDPHLGGWHYRKDFDFGRRWAMSERPTWREKK